MLPGVYLPGVKLPPPLESSGFFLNQSLKGIIPAAVFFTVMLLGGLGKVCQSRPPHRIYFYGMGYRLPVGENKMMEKKPLKAQFIISFILILAFSVAATIATYFLGFVLYGKIEYKNMYPANYYEKKIPDIEDHIRKRGVYIFSRAGQAALEKIIPAEGISYQVMDSSGRRIYGTDKELIVEDQSQLYRKINTTFSLKRKYVRLVPVIDPQGKIAGAVSLSYALAPTYRSLTDKMWISIIFFAVIFSPFFYVILFTWVFARIFAKNIAKPLNLLIEASVKIGEKNLDFVIDYDAPNELGRLCKAFNEMKNELEKSLVLQWRMEQQRREMQETLAHDLKTPLSIIQGYAEALKAEPA